MYRIENDKIYPTLDCVRRLTGEDMIINTGSSIKAEAEVRQYTESVYEELVRSNTVLNYNNIEELIRTNETWRNEFLNVVCRVIYRDYTTEQETPTIVKDTIDSNRLLRLKTVVV